MVNPTTILMNGSKEFLEKNPLGDDRIKIVSTNIYEVNAQTVLETFYCRELKNKENVATVFLHFGVYSGSKNFSLEKVKKK